MRGLTLRWTPRRESRNRPVYSRTLFLKELRNTGGGIMEDLQSPPKIKHPGIWKLDRKGREDGEFQSRGATQKPHLESNFLGWEKEKG